MKTSSSPMTVSRWALLLAWVIVAGAGLAAWGIVRTWLRTGEFTVSLPGVVNGIACGYVFIVFVWVAVTGKLPRFFPLGAQRWPFRPPGT